MALQSSMQAIDPNEKIKIDFEGITVLTPSWADEFVTPLKDKYKGAVVLLNMTNPSVKATLETLKKSRES